MSLTTPTKRLELILNRIKEKPSIQNIRYTVSEILKCSPTDYREFRHKIGRRVWRGVIYLKRNSLYGTIVSLYARKPLIIRGFPKINYSESSKVFNKEVVCEEKLDGTNLVLWQFPMKDGVFMGKTRAVERYDQDGFEGRKWSGLLEETGFKEKLEEICSLGFSPAVELYGYRNPGEFIRYTIPISIKVLEIVDLKTLRFLDYESKVKICEEFGLPIPKVMFRGLLSPKKLEQLEFEATKYAVEDGMEGLVAKYFDPHTKDVSMGKIKCKEIRERCWMMSPRAKIPNIFISKAIRKASESGIPLESNDAVEFVQKESLEDFEQKFVDTSESRIKRLLLQTHQKREDLKIELQEVWHYLDELQESGISVTFENKGKVLSMIASKFEGISGRKVYTAFCTYVSSKSEGEKS